MTAVTHCPLQDQVTIQMRCHFSALVQCLDHIICTMQRISALAKLDHLNYTVTAALSTADHLQSAWLVSTCQCSLLQLLTQIWNVPGVWWQMNHSKINPNSAVATEGIRRGQELRLDELWLCFISVTDSVTLWYYDKNLSWYVLILWQQLKLRYYDKNLNWKLMNWGFVVHRLLISDSVTSD